MDHNGYGIVAKRSKKASSTDYWPDDQTVSSDLRAFTGCGWCRTAKVSAVKKMPIPSSGLI